MAPEDRTHGSWDAALARLEDFLASYPYSRALPDPAVIAHEASLPADFLREDDRARKLLLDAIEARPLSSMEEVTRLRTEVELLVVEVGVLTERLTTAAEVGGDTLRESEERLVRLRRRLEQIRARL